MGGDNVTNIALCQLLRMFNFVAALAPRTATCVLIGPPGSVTGRRRVTWMSLRMRDLGAGHIRGRSAGRESVEDHDLGSALLPSFPSGGAVILSLASLPSPRVVQWSSHSPPSFPIVAPGSFSVPDSNRVFVYCAAWRLALFKYWWHLTGGRWWWFQPLLLRLKYSRKYLHRFRLRKYVTLVSEVS